MKKINPLSKTETNNHLSHMKYALLSVRKKRRFDENVLIGKTLNGPGCYAVFEKEKGKRNKLVYVGESANLNERVREMHRALNHTLPTKIAFKKFHVTKKYGKGLDVTTNKKVKRYMKKHLRISFLKVLVGRKELESWIIAHGKSDELGYNSPQPRSKRGRIAT